MAKLTFTGLDGYIAQLEKLRQSADGITKKALYEGAGVTADEIRSAVEALPTDSDRSALALIARIAESGTSFSQKTPFVRKALKTAKPKAEAEIKKVFETEIKRTMKG